MESVKYIAEKIAEYFHSGKNVPLTSRRERELRSTLRSIEDMVRISSYCVDEDGVQIIRFSNTDLKEIGEIEFIFNRFFPDGNVPEQFSKYTRLVEKAKMIYGRTYECMLEAKLQRDKKILKRASKGKDILEDIEDKVYARSIIAIAEAEEVLKEKSRLVIRYEGEQLYEENIREGSFAGLPQGSIVVFDYKREGLEFNLRKTLEETKSHHSDVEKSIIESLAYNSDTRIYIDEVYDQINQELNK